MSKKPRDNRPYIPPVTRIEVLEGNLKKRWILLAALVVIAGISIAMGVHYALTKEPGWQEVQSESAELNCGRDFVFLYECGSSGISATAEYKNVTALYSQLTQDAYEIFSAETASDMHNVYYLNEHINETVTVDPDLYKALVLADTYGCRDLFLAPVVKEYNGVFLAAADGEAMLYDPTKDSERADYIREILPYVQDPTMISLEILEQNRVRLRVADAYLEFAKENEIAVFLDFGWMKNAFIADYLAEKLTDMGFNNGFLVSYDGFTRNLDIRGETYGVNLFDRLNNTISMPVKLSYFGPMSIVVLRNYPLSEDDQWNYYAYEDGTITSVFLDVTTGMPVSATDNLVSYGSDIGCAEILMNIAPVYLTENFDSTRLPELTQRGIHSIWAEDSELCYTQEDAQLELLADSGGADYRLRFVK